MTQVDLWTLEAELCTPDTQPLCGVDEARARPAGRAGVRGGGDAAAGAGDPGIERLQKALGEKA